MSNVIHCDYCGKEQRAPHMGGWTALTAQTRYYVAGAPLTKVELDLCRECTLRVDDLKMTIKRGLAAAP